MDFQTSSQDTIAIHCFQKLQFARCKFAAVRKANLAKTALTLLHRSVVIDMAGRDSVSIDLTMPGVEVTEVSWCR